VVINQRVQSGRGSQVGWITDFQIRGCRFNSSTENSFAFFILVTVLFAFFIVYSLLQLEPLPADVSRRSFLLVFDFNLYFKF
jgi:hypothetical protein